MIRIATSTATTARTAVSPRVKDAASRGGSLPLAAQRRRRSTDSQDRGLAGLGAEIRKFPAFAAGRALVCRTASRASASASVIVPAASAPQKVDTMMVDGAVRAIAEHHIEIAWIAAGADTEMGRRQGWTGSVLLREPWF